MNLKRDSQAKALKVRIHTNIKLLDVGGEGRHKIAWNLNPRSLKTLGPDKGLPIPRHIFGRAERIPLPDSSVQQLLMERAPLRRVAVLEMVRVIVAGGTIILRHHCGSGYNPHAMAQEMIAAEFSVRRIVLGRLELQQTYFRNVHRVETRAMASNQERVRTVVIGNDV